MKVGQHIKFTSDFINGNDAQTELIEFFKLNDTDVYEILAVEPVVPTDPILGLISIKNLTTGKVHSFDKHLYLIAEDIATKYWCFIVSTQQEYFTYAKPNS